MGLPESARSSRGLGALLKPTMAPSLSNTKRTAVSSVPAPAIGVRLRMVYWGPIVAIASIRWWLDSVVRIKREERRAAMAERPVSFHTGELHVRLERFKARWQ